MNLVRKIYLFTLVISMNFIYSELFEGYNIITWKYKDQPKLKSLLPDNEKK